MSEHELADLLRRAVPEAPDLDTAAIRRRARRQQRGRAAVAGAASVLVVVAVVGVGGALLRADDPARPGRDVASGPTTPGTTTPGTLSPYDVTCGDALHRDETRDRVARLDDVVAVRLCLDFDPRRPGLQPPASPDQAAEEEDADALVHGVPRFLAAIRSLPDARPEYCTTSRGPWIQQALVFRRSDGTQTAVAAGGCERVLVEGRAVEDGEALVRLYLASVDRQRERHAYTRAFDDELTCSSAPRGGPVRAGRERLVLAIACDPPPGAESVSPRLQPRTLDAAQLAELGRAWARPGRPIIRDASGEHPCVDNLPEPPTFLMVATDRSDVLQLIASPCGFLVWHGSDRRAGATIPLDLERLGMEQGPSGP